TAVASRPQPGQAGDCRLDHVDGGGLQRFQKTRRQADRDDVPVPGFAALSGGETQHARFADRGSVELPQQGGRGFVIADVSTGVHVAVAGAVLQRDAPGPAGLARGAAHERRGRTGVFAGHDHCAVARQPMRPVLVAGVQGLLDQQPAETGAIEEQVALDAFAAFQYHRLDETVVAAQLHIDDRAFGTTHPQILRITTQQPPVQARVEMVGVGDVGQRRISWHVGGRRHELAARPRQRVQGIRAQFVGDAQTARLQPELVERQRADVVAQAAETMEIAVADARPVDELDAELEGATGLLDEADIVDAEQVVEQFQMWHGGLAHADRADLFRFHQTDRAVPAQDPRQAGRGHPAGRAAADDDNLLDCRADHEGWLLAPPVTTTRGDAVARCRYARPPLRPHVVVPDRCRDALELQPHGYPERARVAADVAVRVV